MLLDPKFTKALKRGAPLALMCLIDHPDGFVRMWSGQGDLRYDGEVWRGGGLIANIEVSPRTTELRIDEVRLTLNGLSPDRVAGIDGDVQNRLAYTWLAAIGPNRRVIGKPYLLDEMRLDYQTDNIGENGLAAITLTAQTGFWTLERSTDVSWSREEALLRWGNDTDGNAVETGFDFITSLRVKDTKWTIS